MLETTGVKREYFYHILHVDGMIMTWVSFLFPSDFWVNFSASFHTEVGIDSNTTQGDMADLPASGSSSSFPSSLAAIKPSKPDKFHPEPVHPAQPSEGSTGEVNDYTENATPIEIASVIRERKATEGMEDSMVGSMTTWVDDRYKKDYECEWTRISRRAVESVKAGGTFR
jgi:hypothetical protein